MPQNVHKVVIVGGGFGGLKAAYGLKRAPVEVTLLDRRNFHLFQPLLYQVATGGLSPANIAAPLRSVLKRHKNVKVVLAEVKDIDVASRRVFTDAGEFGYDSLIVAAGVWHQYFGRDEWEKYAPGLKTVEDATAMRHRILQAFERAEAEPEPEKRRPWLTFVIVGGGPTGVELAGTLGELAHYTLRNDFRTIQTSEARILLVEGAGRLLPTFPPKLSDRAARALARLGVTVRTGVVVTDIQADHVALRQGDQTEAVPTRTVLWAAGVKASPLGPLLAERTGAELDRVGRVKVLPDLTLPGHPEIFVIGDLAHFAGEDGKPLPGVAQVAMQQGRYAARLIADRLQGKTRSPFRYSDHGSMATIGRNAAVADLGWLYLWGILGWVVWLFIHLLYIDQFHNRLLVLMQWAWNYFTRNRTARLITGEDSPEPERMTTSP